MNVVAFLCGLPGVLRGLREADLDPDPVRQFDRWFTLARRARMHQANALSLSTSTADGRPSSRMVLLKGFDARGFVFYTNYESRKGGELAANPRGAMLFFWSELHRQIRIEGTLERVSREESERYFHSRAHASQVGAWASAQSRVLPDREALEKQFRAFDEKYKGRTVALPPTWGGFRLTPERMEFWQGRAHRLHDRLVYVRQGGAWKIERLAP
jgi:pyridoxamine 5'-phosphate oxidase